jgi:peptide/nickel transport system ATP-binding protein
VLGKLFSRKPPVEAELFRAGRRHQLQPSVMARASGLVRRIRLRQVHHVDEWMRLLDQTSGRIVFDGDEIGAIMPNRFARLPLRKSIQMVFQDPTDSLNPRFTAARAIAIRSCSSATSRAATRCAPAARNSPAGRPSRQSARSVPAPIVRRPEGPCRHRARDCAASQARDPRRADRALDVSVQAVVLNLLQDLKASMGMSYLFVSP